MALTEQLMRATHPAVGDRARMGVRQEIHAALSRSGDLIGGSNPMLDRTITRR